MAMSLAATWSQLGVAAATFRNPFGGFNQLGWLRLCSSIPHSPARTLVRVPPTLLKFLLFCSFFCFLFFFCLFFCWSVWGPVLRPSARIISRRRQDGGRGGRGLHKTDQKVPGRQEESSARRHLPGLFFLFLPVSAIMCFLFSFTVFIVSLLHCASI